MKVTQKPSDENIAKTAKCGKKSQNARIALHANNAWNATNAK